MDANKADKKFEEAILRELYHRNKHEAILLPSAFEPPIMLSHIFRVGCALKNRGLTTGPDRRSGGWHLKLTDAGVTFCQEQPQMMAGH